MPDSILCQICDAPIAGQAFSLSSLTEPPRVLKVCETCAGADYVTIEHDGLDVLVHRDDYLRADRDRLFWAIDQAHMALEDLGWSLEAIKIQGRGDGIEEPFDG